MKVKSESEVAQWCLTLSDPMDCSLPGSSPYMEDSRQEYWNGLPFPSIGDFPNLGTEPWSPALQVDSLPAEQAENSQNCLQLNHFSHV